MPFLVLYRIWWMMIVYSGLILAQFWNDELFPKVGMASTLLLSACSGTYIMCVPYQTVLFNWFYHRSKPCMKIYCMSERPLFCRPGYVWGPSVVVMYIPVLSDPPKFSASKIEILRSENTNFALKNYNGALNRPRRILFSENGNSVLNSNYGNSGLRKWKISPIMPWKLLGFSVPNRAILSCCAQVEIPC